MKLKKINALIIAMLTTGLSGFSQSIISSDSSKAMRADELVIMPKSDIAVKVSMGFSPQISLEFRNTFNERFRWIVGVDYDGNYHNGFGSFNNPTIIYASSDTVITESKNYSDFRAVARYGVERSFKKAPNLYVGANVLFGYQQFTETTSRRLDTLNEFGGWERVFDLENIDKNHTTIISHNLVVGAMITAGWDIPISKRFICNLNVSQSFDYSFNVGQTSNPSTLAVASPVNVFNSDLRAGIGLRYKF